MKDRLLKLIESEGLTPSKLADELGVQRSNISHILSDRNKPSYDFIVKILNRFTGINADWLITGKGSMIKGENIVTQKIVQPDLFTNYPEVSYNNINPKATNEKFLENIPVDNSKELDHSILKNESQGKKNQEFTNVNYIVIFYKNGTFEKYIPRE
jgi:transcriptional regulator with XRE-family HTH domain